MVIPPIVEILTVDGVVWRRCETRTLKTGRVRFQLEAARLRFIDERGRKVCEGALVIDTRAEVAEVDVFAAWAAWMRSQGTPLFCAVCLEERDDVTPQPMGRDDRIVNACATCVGEHPRQGRYSFADGLKSEHVIAGAGTRRKGVNGGRSTRG